MADHRARHRASETGVIRAADLISRFDSGVRLAGHRHSMARPAFAVPGQAAGAGFAWPVISLPTLPSMPSAQSRRTIVAAVSASALGVTAAIAAVAPVTATTGVAPQSTDTPLFSGSAPAAAGAAFTLPASPETAAPSGAVTGADLAASALAPSPAAAPTAAAVPVTVADPSAAAATSAPAAAGAVAAVEEPAGRDAVDTTAADRAAAEKAALQKAAKKAAAAKAAAAAATAAGGDSGAEVTTGGSSAGVKALAFAKAAIGKPYRYGAAGPNAFDCSGLVMSVFKKAGVSLPRTSAAQSRVGTAVSRDQLKPGDLIFFYSPVSHVGIYLGGGKIVHASTSGEPVKISDIGRRPFHNARRL
jgi:peptidoglycan DL-endopeptidase CwlO